MLKYISSTVTKWLRRLTAEGLCLGPIPRHIAFIMDGNRRYAERNNMKSIEGHNVGYQRLIAALEWCLELGVECVSVYAFSVDNFRRGRDEVEALMALATEKLRMMSEEESVLHRYGVRVNILGDLLIVPNDVQRAAKEVMAKTCMNTKATLNICFSYTSSRELKQAVDDIAKTALLANNNENSNNLFDPSGIDETNDIIHGETHLNCTGFMDLLDDKLYTSGCPPVDLLVRTSGENRLSDFLMYQSRYAALHFSQVLWPNFSFLDLIRAILFYQSQCFGLQEIRSLAEDVLRERNDRELLFIYDRKHFIGTHQWKDMPFFYQERVHRCMLDKSSPMLKCRKPNPKMLPRKSESPTGVATPESPSCSSSSSEEMAYRCT